VKRNKKEQGDPEAEDETEEDAPDNEVNENRSATSWRRRPLLNSKKHGTAQNRRMNVL
jgi:hypothetical protein